MMTALKQYLLRKLLKLGYLVEIRRLPNPVKDFAQYRTTPLEQKCLFLLTQSEYGSTAIAHFICQSNKIYGLNNICEVQKIIIRLFQNFIFTDYATIANICAIQITELKAKYTALEYIFDKSPFHENDYQKLPKY